jgi:hypothetical protein
VQRRLGSLVEQRGGLGGERLASRDLGVVS